MNRQLNATTCISGKNNILVIEYTRHANRVDGVDDDFEIERASMFADPHDRQLLPAIKRHPQWLKMVTDRVVAQIGIDG